MKILTFVSYVAVVLYASWVTNELIVRGAKEVREMQKNLYLEKRVEELARTRYGAITNHFVCRVRGSNNEN
jgi:hypothetical protein